MLTIHNILPVVVLYKTSLYETNVYTSLISQYPDWQIVIYDNSPTKTDYSNCNFYYIHDANNGGLGKAYNQAAIYAQNKHIDWILLLDQDTLFPLGAIEQYIKAISANPSITTFAPRLVATNGLFLSPTKYRHKVSSLQATTPTGLVTFNEASPINSGLLIQVNSFLQIGGYNEAVWLDFSDVCFIEKYKQFYPTYYVLPNVTCSQEFSALETDKEKIYKRFCIMLNCASNYPCQSICERLEMTCTILRPTLSRTWHEKTLQYIKAFYKYYLLHQAL